MIRIIVIQVLLPITCYVLGVCIGILHERRRK